jgi:hypothetical protein
MSSPQYVITDYTKRQAHSASRLNTPPAKNKKIDVFDKDGKKLASVGGLGYADYHTSSRTAGNTQTPAGNYTNPPRAGQTHVEGNAGFSQTNFFGI